MAVLVVNFENFKTLCKNNRIYLFKGDNFYDFHFLFEGIIVKTTLLKSTIENIQQFFSDRMFYGAMTIDFNIPIPQDNPLMVVPGIKVPGEIIQDVELVNEDVQHSGVDE